MSYFEYHFSCIKDEQEMSGIIAYLLKLGFESFIEENNELVGYLPDRLHGLKVLEHSNFKKVFPHVAIAGQLIEDKNWNEEWEKNYQPVLIADKCFVRAPFHQSKPGTAFDIVIEPKMAFGTAHHETTQLMAAWLMELDVEGRQVLDMGCGTGILAILANKMSAGFVTGIDNDEWAWQNARDNFKLNGVEKGEVLPGDARQIESGKYDLILANINRNVLLQDMQSYSRGLITGGQLLLSGFYETDRDAIMAASLKSGLIFTDIRKLNNWAVMLFVKVKE